ncbi:hypothetical protein N7493_000154 [Penicillium malachiteum]|uniref:Uncharacterized protein n=1 Tax=Penicillium malachiteum TaxID=1324776 RepID=A0AAD6HWK2_9EURO|nr:hypothetical protein N7493_000154 [Penicillium malachiteum]
MSASANINDGAYSVPQITNVGPLTSTFTPTSKCFLPIYQTSVYGDPHPYAYGYAKHCTMTTWDGSLAAMIQNDPSCIPSALPPGSTYPVYSPANVCPEGYTTACEITRGLSLSSDLANPTLWPMWKMLEFGQTAYKCCPSGFTCDIEATGCSRSPGGVATTSGPYISYLDYDSCESTTLTGVLSIPDGQIGVILITNAAQQESDIAMYPAEQVPLGAQIAIAICAPVAAIALVLAGCVLIRTRIHPPRKQGPRDASNASSASVPLLFRKAAAESRDAIPLTGLPQRTE